MVSWTVMVVAGMVYVPGVAYVVTTGVGAGTSGVAAAGLLGLAAGVLPGTPSTWELEGEPAGAEGVPAGLEGEPAGAEGTPAGLEGEATGTEVSGVGWTGGICQKGSEVLAGLDSLVAGPVMVVT